MQVTIFSPNPGNKSCAVKLTSLNVTVDSCQAVIQIPTCQGQCVSGPRWEATHSLSLKLLIDWFNTPCRDSFPTSPPLSVSCFPSSRFSEASCCTTTCRWSTSAAAARSWRLRGGQWPCSARISWPDSTTTCTSPAANAESAASWDKSLRQR